MSTVSLNDSLEYVMADVPGCPRNLVLREIREAAIELCEFSYIWRVEMISLGILAGISAYEIEKPAGSNLVKVLGVRVEDRNITPKTQDWLDRVDARGWRDLTGTAQYYMMDESDVILLNRKPKDSVTSALKASLCLKPARSATTIPEFLFEDWITVIANGAKSKLMTIQNKTWSNPELGIAMISLFKAGKVRARIEAKKGDSTADLRVNRRRIVSG
ncbi:MAG: hypothetical protein JKY67_08525 [Pseudomonadales bacterium]|nr:hypothetical protein [Pseudomonadales bacterium]